MNGLTTFVVANIAGATALALIALAICPLVRRPEFTHKVWLVVLLKLIAPSLLVLPILPQIWPTSKGLQDSDRSFIDPTTPLDNSRTAGEYSINDEIVTDPREHASDNHSSDPSDMVSRAASQLPDNNSNALKVLVAVWLGGTIGYWTLVVVGAVRFNRKLRFAKPVSTDTNALIKSVASRLRLSSVPVAMVSHAAVSPAVWAPFGRPRIILPNSLWIRLSHEQRETIIAHELTHVIRYDHWIRRLEVFIVGLYWWLPIAWLARVRLRRAEEASCDARVLRAFPHLAEAYAEALVETAASIRQPVRMSLASGVSPTVFELQRRITMILSNRPTPTPCRTFAAVSFAVAVTLLALRPGFAQTPPENSKSVWLGLIQDNFPTPPAERAKNSSEPIASDAQPAPTTTPRNYNLTTSGPANQQSHDEIELLEAQLMTKRAHLQVAKAAIYAADRKLDLLKSSSAPKMEIYQAEDERNLARAKLDVQEAELREHEIKLKQAKRRLEATTGRQPQPATRALTLDRFTTSTDSGKSANTSTASNRDTTDRIRNDAAQLRVMQDQLDATIAQHSALQARIKQAMDELSKIKVQADKLADQKSELEKRISDLDKKRENKKPVDPTER